MPAPVNIKKYGLSAGKYYSSGAWHGAYDIPCPTGTPVRAAMDGRVLGCARGVKPNREGHNPGSGAPSNWINVYTAPFPGFGKGVTSYYQHLLKLAPGIKVGSRVKAGQVIGWSDNTGNSSGPHLHFHIQYGKRGRYDHYGNHDLAVYPPSKAYLAWDKAHAAKPAAPAAPAAPAPALPAVSISKLIKAAKNPRMNVAGVRSVRKALGVNMPSQKFGPLTKALYKKWQRKLGYTGAAADGIPGPKSLKALAKKTGKFRAVP